MPEKSQRARAAPPHTHWEGSTCLSRSNGSGQKSGCRPMGYLAEVELTQTTEAGGSRARAEKEPEEPIVDLWIRMSEIGRKGRMGSRMEGYGGMTGVADRSVVLSL